MTVRIHWKRSCPEAVLPTSSVGDVGFDIRSVEHTILRAGTVTKVKTGLQIADFNPKVRIPAQEEKRDGKTDMISEHVPETTLTIFPKIEGRSSLGAAGIFPIAGIIDPQYRGEIIVTLANLSDQDHIVQQGDKIAQFVIYTTVSIPDVTFCESDYVTQTDRGDKGFGSTGR